MTQTNQFTFQPATRAGIKPLIGLYGESNSGKTYSALLLARGIAGRDGKILGIDTESGRMALYADMVPGGFLRADFEPPFSPRRYIDALDAAEEQGADVIVFDSFSHEWFGEGGVLDMAGANEDGGKKGLAVWKAPKLEHAKLVNRLLRSKTYVIVCLRAKFKSRQVKNNGRTEIVKDDFVTAQQDEDLLFEMTAHCEMQTGKPGCIRLTKWSVPDLAECFPKDGDEQLGIKHGEAIARWASGTNRPSNAQAPANEPDDLMTQAREAVDAAELNLLVGQYATLPAGPRKTSIKAAIAARAREKNCIWNERSKSYTDAQ